MRHKLLTPEPLSALVHLCLLMALAASGPSSLQAGTVVTTFENPPLAANSVLDNSAPSAYFERDGNRLSNNYSTDFGLLSSGWGISTKTDNTMAGFTNQFSAVPGSGAGGSATYAVGFLFGFPTIDKFHPADAWIDLADGGSPVSIEVANTTYAYFSMKDGDGFSEAFGAGDFLLLDIRGYDALGGVGNLVGTVEFHLANYVDDDSLPVGDWSTIDLTSLGGARSLRFGIRSSDNDPDNGINTPAYVAIDNLALDFAPEPSSRGLAILGLLTLAAWRRIRRPPRRFRRSVP